MVCPKTLIRCGRQLADLTQWKSSKFAAHKQMFLGDELSGKSGTAKSDLLSATRQVVSKPLASSYR